jgi:hypothetical protein
MISAGSGSGKSTAPAVALNHADPLKIAALKIATFIMLVLILIPILLRGSVRERAPTEYSDIAAGMTSSSRH